LALDCASAERATDRAGHDVQNRAAELAVRAKIRAGEITAAIPKATPGAYQGKGDSVSPLPKKDVLAEAGIEAAPPAATVRRTVRDTKSTDRVCQLAGAFARRATDCTSGARVLKG